jgi:S1-C subfamily serine protease
MNENALRSYSDSIVNLFEKISRMVVAIQLESRKIGSGVVWSDDGYVVTCGHFIRKTEDLEVCLYDNRTFPAKIVGSDTYSNIALLKIEGSNLKAIDIGDSENLKTGQLVFALANRRPKQPSITHGIITSRRASLDRRQGEKIGGNVIITDAHLNFRYLGGPLIDVDGELIGLNVAFSSGRGIVVGVNKVKNIVEQLKKHGKINHGYLGLILREIFLPKDLAEQDAGLIVISVKKNTPAKKAGLLIGDVILKFNNELVDTVADLDELLTEDVIGKSINLSVLRGEKKQDLKITPG